MIKVSDITAYLKCPRISYFLSKGHELVIPGYAERILFKELALRYDSAFNNEDKLSFLSDELTHISAEIRLIYRSELVRVEEDALLNSVSNVRSCLDAICSNLGDFYSNKTYEVEPILQSERFGLTGSPDKLIKLNDEIIPSIIKTGGMPENGVWQSDRLQLTAYAVLVEEKYNSVVGHGFVEYARFGKVREAKIKRSERRKVLQIRDRIKKIQEGFMPERPKDAPCEHCGFKEMCEVKSTLASRFF